MTKKHFIALADTLKALFTMNNPSKDTVLSFITGFCKEQNPRFNTDRFTDYVNGKCGPNGGKIK